MHTRYNFVVYKDRKGQFRWRLVASNGLIVADSGEGYTRRRDCILAIGRVRRAIAGAAIAT